MWPCLFEARPSFSVYLVGIRELVATLREFADVGLHDGGARHALLVDLSGHAAWEVLQSFGPGFARFRADLFYADAKLLGFLQAVTIIGGADFSGGILIVPGYFFEYLLNIGRQLVPGFQVDRDAIDRHCTKVDLGIMLGNFVEFECRPPS